MAQMTKKEILNETVAHYSANPNKLRSANENGSCVFNGKDGTHCAIGRCMLPHLKELGSDLAGNLSNIDHLCLYNNAEKLDDILEERYRGHDEKFWSALQALHDTPRFWDASGITFAGEVYTNEILTREYKDDAKVQ